jgi:transposase
MDLKKQGKSNVEIGKTYGVAEGTIRKWIKKGETKKI